MNFYTQKILRLVIAALFAIVSSSAFSAATTLTAPPNLVEINERITTSGQPSAEWLDTLKSTGFEAVIYLAPATVGDAVKEEHLIVSRQGLLFINIPIKFDNPTGLDFEHFAAVMDALAKRKVLVHCQINLRASSMIFLYRTIVRKENPNMAYESVTKVWVPSGAWKPYIQSQLKKYQINFEPF